MIAGEQKLEMVVYIARKLGWTLGDIGSLTPLQFVRIYNELIFQDSLDIWREQQSLAFLLAAIYNTIPKSRGGKTFRARDFYDAPRPTRTGEGKEVMTEVDIKATKAGIKLPKE